MPVNIQIVSLRRERIPQRANVSPRLLQRDLLPVDDMPHRLGFPFYHGSANNKAPHEFLVHQNQAHVCRNTNYKQNIKNYKKNIQNSNYNKSKADSA